MLGCIHSSLDETAKTARDFVVSVLFPNVVIFFFFPVDVVVLHWAIQTSVSREENVKVQGKVMSIWYL